MSGQHGNERGSTFRLGLVLNTGFTVFELAVGSLTGSLALIADGTHNLTDSLTLGIAAIAERIGRRHPDQRRSYGYGRVRIIASLLNAGILIAIAIFIASEAIERLGEPHDVPGLVVAGVAAIGIGINGTVAYLLSRQKQDLNARSAYINMLYDTLSSVGALLAGIAIALFGLTWLDSAVGIIIAVMLLSATFGIIKDALHILLEGVPPGIDLRLVQHDLRKIADVEEVDDVHAWTIDSEYYAFSCHLVIAEDKLRDSRTAVEVAKQLLMEKYGFRHSTIEVEPLERKGSTDDHHS